jgi:hypothetical protein
MLKNTKNHENGTNNVSVIGYGNEQTKREKAHKTTQMFESELE